MKKEVFNFDNAKKVLVFKCDMALCESDRVLLRDKIIKEIEENGIVLLPMWVSVELAHEIETEGVRIINCTVEDYK